MQFGGERGIRTLDTRKRIHTFQACSLSHSDTSPFGRDNNEKNEICQVETIDLEQKKILGELSEKIMSTLEDAYMQSTAKKAALPAITLAALGVVFGDIGTSPLYVLRQTPFVLTMISSLGPLILLFINPTLLF